jgi:hypothetical protein
MHIRIRVDSLLPDGAYELVPQAEPIGVQLNQAEVAQDLTQNSETPTATPVEGKPWSISPTFKTTHN